MQARIEVLLHFSRVGQTVLKRQPIDPNQVLEQIIKLMKVSRNDAAFEMRLPPSLPIVNGDPILIEEFSPT